jgi:hypothetical protein
MANVKNFSQIGVGTDVQYGKGGPRLINAAGTFNFRNATNAADAAINTAGIVSSAGNITLTTGNLVLTSSGGTIVVSGDTTLSRQQAGVYQFNGTSAIIVPGGTTGQRPASAITAMVRYNGDTTTLEYYTGTQWFTLATGGGTAGLQAEIDAIETSLGPAISSSGVYVPGGFTGIPAGATSFTNAIQKVADALSASDTLEELKPPVATGNIIYASSNTAWSVGAPGATTGVQPYDAGLAALAAKATTGLLVQTAADTYTSRTLTAPAAGITITNPDGVAGNPTFALANDLAAVEGLSTNGLTVRTAADTWTTRAVTGTATRIIVTNGDGVAGAPTIDLSTISDAGTGTFVKITRDAYGRVAGTTAVLVSDISTLIDGTYVNTTGDTMTGTLTMSGAGTQVVLPNAPTSGVHAVNRDYVDARISGLSWKNPVVATSTGSNVNIAVAPATLDGVTLVSGDRILLRSQTVNTENVIYIFNSVGTPLTIAPDTDTGPELVNATVFVTDGTQFSDTGWTQVGTLAGGTIQWVQFSGANTYVAGSGLTLSGNTFNVGGAAGIVVGADDVGLGLFNTTTSGLILTTDGTTRSAVAAAKLHLLIPASSGLVQDATGLYVPNAGITNAKLANSSITFGGDSGTSAVSLGGTLTIAGTAAQGITTAGTANTVTITAANATAAQKGVASFTTGQFVVTAGNVALGTIPAGSLPGSGGITFTGTTGTDGVFLGESMAIIGADSAITTTMGTNSLSILLNTVSVAKGGTGSTTLTAGQILVGNGTSAVQQTATLAFNSGTNALTVGTSTLTGAAAGDTSLTSTVTNANIQLLPNGTGHVIVGAGATGIIRSNTGQSLTVRGTTALTLESVAGSTLMVLPVGTTTKVSISGPSAAQYATSLSPNDLVNKQYVDQSVASGATGAVKSVTATVALNSAGTTNIGTALPAGSTITSVKVNVATADTGTGILSVGKAGSISAYMTTTENDPQTLGLYLAETMVLEAGSIQVIATVAGTPATGTSTVIVSYI